MFTLRDHHVYAEFWGKFLYKLKMFPFIPRSLKKKKKNDVVPMQGQEWSCKFTPQRRIKTNLMFVKVKVCQQSRVQKEQVSHGLKVDTRSPIKGS